MTTIQKTASTTNTKKPPTEAKAGKITSTTTHVTADVTKDDLAGIEAETIDVAAYGAMDAEARAGHLSSLYGELLNKQGKTTTLGRQCAILYHRLGVILIAEKENVEHGQWLDWLDDHAIDEKHAQRARQIARHFKLESDLKGYTLTEALAKSGKKTEKAKAPASERRQIIKNLEAMKEKIHKLSQDVGGLAVAREPLLRYIDDLETELRVLRTCCVGEVVPQ